MKRIGIVSIILILTWGLCLNTCSQAVVVKQMNLEEITSTAKYSFSGVCTSVETRHDDEANRDAVFFKFIVSKVIKGEQINEITFKMSKVAIDIGRSSKFKTGDEVVLFLYGKSDIGFTSPVGLGQGKFTVRYSRTGEKEVVNENNNLNIFKGIDKDKYKSKFAGSKFLDEVDRVMTRKSGAVVYQTFIALVESMVH